MKLKLRGNEYSLRINLDFHKMLALGIVLDPIYPPDQLLNASIYLGPLLVWVDLWRVDWGRLLSKKSRKLEPARVSLEEIRAAMQGAGMAKGLEALGEEKLREWEGFVDTLNGTEIWDTSYRNRQALRTTNREILDSAGG